MSSLLAIQLRDRIYMGSDTAISTNIDNISYRVSDNAIKMYNFENMIIFCSGDLKISYKIMREFSRLNKKSILNLQNIALNNYHESKRVEIMVGKVLNGCSCIYQLSSYNNYQIIKHTNVSDTDIGVWTGGFKTEGSYNIATRCISNGMTLIETYTEVFDNIKCEEIGGRLEVYELTSKNTMPTSILNCKISESNLRVLSNDYSLQMINAEVIRGKLGQFAEVQAHQIVVGDFGQKISNDVLDIDIDLDGVVQQEELYNQVVISYQNGLQVLDRGNRERIRLGNYKPGKYGLVIKDKSGSTTVLDEDGILQTWQEGNVDNVDADNPLSLHIYVPQQTNIIHKAVLRFRREKFRAYSKAIDAASIPSFTSNDGGAVVDTSTGGHTDTLSNLDPTTDNVDEAYRHNHGLGRDGEVDIRVRYRGGSEGWLEFVPSGAHTHGVHSHKLTIPAHKHAIEIPEHNHEIEYGIYESTLPDNIRIKVNGLDYTSYLGGRNGYFNSDEDDIDITPILEVGKWNVIELSSETLGRIDASVFIQAFINTTRKSVVLDDRYLETNIVGGGSNYGKSAITGRRSVIESNVDKLFRISIAGGVARTHSIGWTGGQDYWKDEFSVGNADEVSICFDGVWKMDDIDENKWKFKSQDTPHIFWIDAGTLYTQNWNDVDSKRVLASGVSGVSTIKGWQNASFSTSDQGIICSYVKSGKVYYRNYCMQPSGIKAWESEREVEEFTGTAKSVNMYMTNDYRIGFVIEDNSNKTHILLTDRNWAGMAIAPHTISVAPTQIIGNLIPIEYPMRYHTEHLSVAPTEIGVGSDKLVILNANNIPTTKLDENNIEYQDWGWAIEFEVDSMIPSLTLAQVMFTSVETEIPIGMSNIELIDKNKYKVIVDPIVDSGINNIFGDIRITISGVTNLAGFSVDTTFKDFTPTNLVPTFIPLPEVEVIYNE